MLEELVLWRCINIGGLLGTGEKLQKKLVS